MILYINYDFLIEVKYFTLFSLLLLFYYCFFVESNLNIVIHNKIVNIDYCKFEFYLKEIK